MIVTETYIYHCQTCGRIERHESDSAVLLCCGKAMTMACAESHSIDEAVPSRIVDARLPRKQSPT